MVFIKLAFFVVLMGEFVVLESKKGCQKCLLGSLELLLLAEWISTNQPLGSFYLLRLSRAFKRIRSINCSNQSFINLRFFSFAQLSICFYFRYAISLGLLDYPLVASCMIFSLIASRWKRQPCSNSFVSRSHPYRITISYDVCEEHSLVITRLTLFFFGLGAICELFQFCSFIFETFCFLFVGDLASQDES